MSTETSPIPFNATSTDAEKFPPELIFQAETLPANFDQMIGNVLDQKASYQEWEVSPQYGTPGTTKYLFVASTSDGQALSLKLYDRAYNNTYHVAMTPYKSLYYWYGRINFSGVFDYRYVYRSTKNPISTTPSFEMTNSHNNLDYSTAQLVWPFGADGSSWGNRLGWYRGGESGSCGGYLPNQGTHVYHSCTADDSYALDWNRCSPYEGDYGATFRSPLDGEVIKVKTSGLNGGYGKYVDIRQYSEDGTAYVFRIAHLSDIPTWIYDGRWVRAGYTMIGAIGDTGGSSTASHAHCALYQVDNSNCYDAQSFTFNASH